MINREKFLQTAGSVLKHAMCSKREGSGTLCGRDPAVLGLYSVAVHAAYPAGQPRARTIVFANLFPTIFSQARVFIDWLSYNTSTRTEPTSATQRALYRVPAQRQRLAS